MHIPWEKIPLHLRIEMSILYKPLIPNLQGGIQLWIFVYLLF
ncbi:hypothetical protein RINTHH_3710 [Richelia intracellularis HH01]|uniref:Uncharacterized protein n=1 Tax=Richelia intracellularis HH01 TaxID=1165094 RepID=M1X4P9_9NOST|nr:hypothetical protein RINTHH_3710 [Richelia intracellularis HH01]